MQNLLHTMCSLIKKYIIARWLFYLDQFTSEINHTPGLQNPGDYLSRMVIEYNLNLDLIVTIIEKLYLNNINIIECNQSSSVNSNFVVNNINISWIIHSLKRKNIKKHQSVKEDNREIKYKINSNDS